MSQTTPANQSAVLDPASSSGNESLINELQKYVKTQYAAHAYPRQIHFVEDLPKTPSGKVQRYLLRTQRANH